MINLPRAACLILLTIVVAGCSETPTSPTSPTAGSGSLALTAGQLAGTWTLSSMQAAGQPPQASPAAYNLSIDGNRLSTRVDCNTCSGTVTLTGDTFTAGPNLACTRAACPTMAFESAYLAILGGDSTASVSGNTLVLSSARGVLRFTR